MPGDVTQILEAIRGGEADRVATLLDVVYDELRGMAARQMARERPGQTLQPTALVHEAYLRLVGDRDLHWDDSAHFFGAAAEAMRRILVDRARRQAAVKHGGGRRRLAMAESPETPGAHEAEPVDLLKLDDALRRLEEQDTRMSEVVKLRFFAGLTIEETARGLNLTPRTVNRDWVKAKAWLHQEIIAGESCEDDDGV